MGRMKTSRERRSHAKHAQFLSRTYRARKRTKQTKQNTSIRRLNDVELIRSYPFCFVGVRLPWGVSFFFSFGKSCRRCVVEKSKTSFISVFFFLPSTIEKGWHWLMPCFPICLLVSAPFEVVFLRKTFISHRVSYGDVVLLLGLLKKGKKENEVFKLFLTFFRCSFRFFVGAALRMGNVLSFWISSIVLTVSFYWFKRPRATRISLLWRRWTICTMHSEKWSTRFVFSARQFSIRTQKTKPTLRLGETICCPMRWRKDVSP